jgi:hypothetical protein
MNRIKPVVFKVYGGSAARSWTDLTIKLRLLVRFTVPVSTAISRQPQKHLDILNTP